MISIVIPTYNEKKNIEMLLPQIFKILKKDAEVIIVDDNSTDGTRDSVKELMKKFNVRLLKRDKKMGIGSAYKDGFKMAKGDIVFEMDADLSHDPKHLKSFIEKITEGYDVVVGSRYIKGGKRKDPFYRKIFPAVGNFFYKSLMKSQVRDTTSGYRAYKREVLNKIELNDLPNDFSFQAAILFKLILEKAKVTEIPIDFKDRMYGETKYSSKELLSNFKFLLKLIYNR